MGRQGPKITGHVLCSSPTLYALRLLVTIFGMERNGNGLSLRGKSWHPTTYSSTTSVSRARGLHFEKTIIESSGRGHRDYREVKQLFRRVLAAFGALAERSRPLNTIKARVVPKVQRLAHGFHNAECKHVLDRWILACTCNKHPHFLFGVIGSSRVISGRAY